MTKRLISKLLVFFIYLTTILSIQAADITEGLIGYWPLDGNAKDESGNNYHGELDGKVKWEANGRVNGGARFDGKGSHIKVAQKDLMPKTLEFTVVTWINGHKAQDWAAVVSARGTAKQAYIYLVKSLESIVQPSHSSSVGRATGFKLEDCGFESQSRQLELFQKYKISLF